MPKYLVELTDGRKFEVEADQAPTENDLMSYIGEGQAPAAPKETPGYLSQLGTALSIGWRQMTSGVKATFNAATGDVPDTAEAMAQMGALQQEQQAAQSPEDIQLNQDFERNKAEYDAARGIFPTIGALGGYVGSIASNPGAAFKQAVQSAPNAAISAGTGLAGYALGGMLGAGAGIETGPGAILTGIAGAAAGGAVSNTLMESGPAIYDILNERTNGAASTMTADQISQYLRQNPDVMSEGLKTGAIRGSVIGLIEGLGMKGAGRIMTIPERAAARAAQKTLVGAGIDVASKEAVESALLDPALKNAVSIAAKTAKDQFTTPGNLGRLAGASALEVGSSGAGELAAQTASGQETDMTAAVQEMMGEVGMSAPTALVSKGLEARKYLMPQVKEAVETAAISLNQAAAEGVPVSKTADAFAFAENLRRAQEEGAAADIQAAQMRAQEEYAAAQAAAERQAQFDNLTPNEPIAPAPVGSPVSEIGTEEVANLEAGSGDNTILGIGDDGGAVPTEAQPEAAGQTPQKIVVSPTTVEPTNEESLSVETPKTKIEDFSNPDEFYRVVVGDEAFNDIVESGQVRTNAANKNKAGSSLADKLAARPTAFPSFSKGQASVSYAKDNPNHYIVVTADESIKPSTSGRHSKGKTMFPTAADGTHLPSLDGKKVRVYKHLANGSYELVYDRGSVVGATKPTQPSSSPFVRAHAGDIEGEAPNAPRITELARQDAAIASGAEKALLKPYANIAIPDLEKLPDSDWSRRRDYLEGKSRLNKKEKEELLKTPKQNWETYHYNENARINDVAASLRAAIQDMQSSRPDLENQFGAKATTEAKGTETKRTKLASKGKVGASAAVSSGTGAELQQQPATLPSISEQPEVAKTAGELEANTLPNISSAGGNVIETNAQKFAAKIRAQFKADELADKAEKLKEKYYSINASAGKKESESKDKTFLQWKQTEAKAKQAKADAFAELRKQNKGFTLAQLEDKEPFMVAKTLEQHGLTKKATDMGYVRKGDTFTLEQPITPTTETPTNASFEDLEKEVENFNPTKGAARKDPATPDKIKDVADRVIASGEMDYIENIGYFFSDIGGDIPAKTRDPVILRLRSVLLEQAQRLKNHAKGKQPISPQETPTSIATEGQTKPMSGDSGSVARDKTKPEQMTPEEVNSLFYDAKDWANTPDDKIVSKYQKQFNASDAYIQANPFAPEYWRENQRKVASGASPLKQHTKVLNSAIEAKKPVSAAAVDAYGIKLPEGYVKDGELYVYKVEEKAAEKSHEKQAPSEKVEAGKPADKTKRDNTQPAQMTPEEYAGRVAGEKFVQSVAPGKEDAWWNAKESQGAPNRFAAGTKMASQENGKFFVLDLGTNKYKGFSSKREAMLFFKSKDGAAQRAYIETLNQGKADTFRSISHRIAIDKALAENQPVSSVAVDAYKVKLPQGYEKRGDLYVSGVSEQPQVSQPAPTQESKQAPETAVNQKPEQPASQKLIDMAKLFGGRIAWADGDMGIIEAFQLFGSKSLYVAIVGDRYSTSDFTNLTPSNRKELLGENEELFTRKREELIQTNEKRLAENPDGPFTNGRALVVSKSVPDKVASVFKEWAKMLGLNAPTRIVLTTFNDGIEMAAGYGGKFRRIGATATKQEGERGVSVPLGDNDFHIAYQDDISFARILEVIAHELGHVLEKQAFKNLPQDQRQEIILEHEKWLKRVGSQKAIDGIKELRAMRSGKVHPGTDIERFDELNSYWKSFSEWFADQVARWSTTTAKPLSVVEKFFARLGKKLREFFFSNKHRFAPNEKVADWLNSLSPDFQTGEISSPSEEVVAVNEDASKQPETGYGAKLDSVRKLIRDAGPKSFKAQQQALTSLMTMPVSDLQDAFNVLTGDTTKLTNKRQLANNILNEILAENQSGKTLSAEDIFGQSERELEKERAEQEKLTESRREDLNSIIGTPQGVEMNAVSVADGQESLALVHNSGDVPGVLNAFVGTSKEFLANPQNEKDYPELYAILKAGRVDEGNFAYGRAFVFTDGIGVNASDRANAAKLGISPAVAAVRRVLIHEGLVHRGIYGLPARLQMQILQWVKQNAKPEDLDALAKTYPQYADWATNPQQMLGLAEEFLAKNVEKMTRFPTSGPLARLVEILKDIWRYVTGKDGEPTVQNLRDIVKLLKAGAKAADARLVNGGGIKMSQLRAQGFVTPEMDAEYAKAVESGDMVKAQRMVDVAAKAAGYNTESYKGWMPFTGDWADTNGLGQPLPNRKGTKIPITTINRTTPFPTFLSGEHPLDGIAGFFASDKKVADKFAAHGGDWRTDKFYLKDGKQFTIDAEGKKAGELQFTKADSRFRDAVRSGNYDSILLKGTADEGDVFVQLNPNQIKSADPITRDDAGNVIPLSQRFNPAKADIRESRISYANPLDAQLASASERMRQMREKQVPQEVSIGDDTRYLELAKDPEKNQAELQRMVDDAARKSGKLFGKWFHGQPSKKSFTVFNPSLGKSFGGWNRIGSWFTLDKTQAKEFAEHFDETGKLTSGNVYDSYLWMKNPLSVEGFDGLTALWSEYTGKDTNNATQDDINKFRNELRQRGFDGLVIANVEGDSLGGAAKSQTYALALDSSQIKSADAIVKDDNGKIIPLSQRFGVSNDIRGVLPSQIRNEIRKAYDAAIQGQGSVQAPLQQVYDLAKAAIPTLTEKQFGEQVQALYEDGSAFLVPTDRSADMLAAGEKWGVYDVAGLPASYVGVMPSQETNYGNDTNNLRPRGTMEPRGGAQEYGGNTPTLSPNDKSPRANALRAVVDEASWRNLSPEQKKNALDAFGAKRLEAIASKSELISSSYRITRSLSDNAFAALLPETNADRLVVEINPSIHPEHQILNKSALEAYAFMYDMMQEEIIHFAQHYNAWQQWVKGGAKGSINAFEREHFTNQLRDVYTQRNAAIQAGNSALVGKIDSAIIKAWNLYDPSRQISNIGQLQSALAGADVKLPEFMMELTRQLVQINRQDFTTETGWAKFRDMLIKWANDVRDALRNVLASVRGGEFGQILKDEISSIERIVDQIEKGDGVMPSQETTKVYATPIDRNAIENEIEKSSKAPIDEDSLKGFILRTVGMYGQPSRVRMARLDPNAPLQVDPQPNGELVIGLGARQAGEIIRNSRSPQAGFKYLADAIEEEMIHFADLLAMRTKWEAQGSNGSFTDFIRRQATEIKASVVPKNITDKQRTEFQKNKITGKSVEYQGYPLTDSQGDVIEHWRTEQQYKPKERLADEFVQQIADGLDDITQLPDEVLNDDYLRSIGAEYDGDFQTLLTAQSVVLLRSKAKEATDPEEKQKLEQAADKGTAFLRQGASQAGSDLKMIQQIQKDPRFAGMFAVDSIKTMKKDDQAAVVDPNFTNGADGVAGLNNQANTQASDDLERDIDRSWLERAESLLPEKAQMLLKKIREWLGENAKALERIELIKAFIAKKTGGIKQSVARNAAESTRYESMTVAQAQAEIAKEQKGINDNNKKIGDALEKVGDILFSTGQADSPASGASIAGKIAKMPRKERLLKPGKMTELQRLLDKTRDGWSWKQIFTMPQAGQVRRRADMLQKVKENDAFKALNDEEKQHLVELLDQAWYDRKATYLAGKLKANPAVRLPFTTNKGAARKLEEATPELLKAFNDGTFNKELFNAILAKKYGVKPIDKAAMDRAEKLAEELQDPNLPDPVYAKKADELLKLIADTQDLNRAKILNDFWVTSVLAGPRTWFDIGLAALNGLQRILVDSTNLALHGDFKTAGTALSRFVGIMPQAFKEAAHFIKNGDVSILVNSKDQFARFLGKGLRGGQHTSTSYQLANWKEDKEAGAPAWKKAQGNILRTVGRFMQIVERLLTALDHINATATKYGYMPIAIAQNQKKYTQARLPNASEMDQFRTQAKAYLLGGREPSTPSEQTVLDAWTRHMSDKFYSEWQDVVDGAAYAGAVSSGVLDPEGIVGAIYNNILGAASRATNAADSAKVKAKAMINDPTHNQLDAYTKHALATIGQLAAYSARNLLGFRFIRFGAVKFNDSLTYIPAIGLLRLNESENKHATKQQMIWNNQAFGVALTILGTLAIQLLAEEDDPEKRGFDITGSLDGLTAAEKKQISDSGQKEYTLTIYRNGKPIRLVYKTWPISAALSAIGTLADMVKYKREKWDEKQFTDRLVAAVVVATTSTLDSASMSQFAELIGKGQYADDPDEAFVKKITRVTTNFAGGFVPRVFKDLDFWLLDPNARKYDTVWQNLGKEIPIWRQHIGGEKLDIFANPVKTPRSPWSRAIVQQPEDEAYNTLGLLNSRDLWLVPSNPELRTIGTKNHRRGFTPEEQNRYIKLVGAGYKQLVEKYGERILQMPKERAKAFLSDKSKEVRDKAEKKAIRKTIATS